MIIKASQRGNGAQLARHLMNTYDNDHIDVHEVRGFVSQNLQGAFNEADAVSRGTRCKQFLFSVSFSPPQDKDVSADTFLDAIDRAEEKLGLSGQPRAIVFHEKEGRRHAHAVWSRIDAQSMKAVNLPFFKTRLNNLSKDIFLEQGWKLPRGYRENWKNPLAFDLADLQQAKRIGISDPRELKMAFQESWHGSDSGKAFAAALEDKGFYLARGDRRSFVAVDLQGEVFSVPRMLGKKTKEVKAKLGDPNRLPSVADTQSMIKSNLSAKFRGFMAEQQEAYKQEAMPLMAEKRALVANQRIERAKLKRSQVKRHVQESKARATRYRTGIMGVVDLLFGKKSAIRKENEADLAHCNKRDHREREGLFASQHSDRRTLQKRIALMRASETAKRQAMKRKMADVLNITREYRNTPDREREKSRNRGRDRSLDLSL